MRCSYRWAGRGCGRLMCGPAVVVEDVGAGPVCGCYQKIQTNQLFEIPSGSAMVQATLHYASLPQVLQELGGGDDVNTVHLAAVFVKRHDDQSGIRQILMNNHTIVV